MVIDSPDAAAQTGVGFDSPRDVSLRRFDRSHQANPLGQFRSDSGGIRTSSAMGVYGLDAGSGERVQ